MKIQVSFLRHCFPHEPTPLAAGHLPGIFLPNNVTFIAINGLVGLRLAPLGWTATLPVMGYVVGGARSTGLAAKTQHRAAALAWLRLRQVRARVA